MRIAIAQSNLTLKGGGERVVLKVAEHYRAPVYVAEYDPKNTFEQFGDIDIRVMARKGLASRLPYGRVSQGLSYGLGFYNLKLGDEFDVINAHMAPSHWVRNRNERVLWYCHTPLRDIYDLYHYRMSMRKPHARPLYIAGAAAVRRIDQGVVKKIRYIIANSSNVRARIERYYKRTDARVLGGGVEFRKYSNKGDGRYFFYPSRISQNKRQDFAIEAFRIFSRRVKGYRLVIAGAVSKDRFYRDYYKGLVGAARRVGNVEFMTDPTPDEKQLTGLYSRSTAVLYPPINEDYGLVPLEGAASRKPVIAANDGGVRETILPNKTGVLVDTPEEMAAAMERIVKDSGLAERMGREARKRVEREYSWERFFREFDRYLRLASRR
jgi:glycosyltransferase involved in cell wall biosynthesis